MKIEKSEKATKRESSYKELSKDANKFEAKSSDNDKHDLKSKEKRSTTTSKKLKSRSKNARPSKRSAFQSSSEEENPVATKSKSEQKKKEDSSSDEIPARCLEAKKFRNRIASSSSSSNDDIFPQLQGVAERRQAIVKVEKLYVPSISKCIGAKLSGENVIASWIYERSSGRDSKDSASSKSDGKTRHRSNWSTGSKNSRSYSGTKRDRHQSGKRQATRDDSSSLSDQIHHESANPSVPSEPAFNGDTAGTTSSSKPSKLPDSATSISSTNQHAKAPQASGSNALLSRELQQQISDRAASMINQHKSDLPIRREKRRLSMSSSDRDAEMSDDSVSILDDNFQGKKKSIVGSLDQKKRKVEAIVKEEAHSQTADVDAEFFQVNCH